ncbi:hypothetical protein BRX37_21340 [Sphingomonas sp. S-NIH.Pt3_0716]|nr:hypothetical protein BRX37_21340 [Sphingomonas sp. S-NIH.Pt3_0716]
MIEPLPDFGRQRSAGAPTREIDEEKAILPKMATETLRQRLRHSFTLEEECPNERLKILTYEPVIPDEIKQLILIMSE